jgi:hypothetical protein
MTSVMRGAMRCSQNSLPIYCFGSALKPRKRIKVVESDTAPKSHIAGLVWAAKESDVREPLGHQIVELPDDLTQFESRDPRSTFTMYMPIGSLTKGEALVTQGGPGKTFQGTPCHGEDLRGAWTFVEHRRPVAELHVSPILRLRARANWRMESAVGAGGAQSRAGLRILSGSLDKNCPIWTRLVASRGICHMPLQIKRGVAAGQVRRVAAGGAWSAGVLVGMPLARSLRDRPKLTITTVSF